MNRLSKIVLGAALAVVTFVGISQSSKAVDHPSFYDMFETIQKVPGRAHTRSSEFTNTEKVDAIVQSNKDYAVTVSTVTLDNVTVEDLYNFTSDVRNDVHWFPGVTNVDLISGTHGLGTVYEETINFGSFNFTNTVEVIQFIPMLMSLESSRGPLNSDGLLVWDETENGSSLTIYGLLPLFPGVTIEQVKQATEISFNNLLNHFSTTGTITTAGEVIHVD